MGVHWNWLHAQTINFPPTLNRMFERNWSWLYIQTYVHHWTGSTVLILLRMYWTCFSAWFQNHFLCLCCLQTEGQDGGEGERKEEAKQQPSRQGDSSISHQEESKVSEYFVKTSTWQLLVIFSGFQPGWASKRPKFSDPSNRMLADDSLEIVIKRLKLMESQFTASLDPAARRIEVKDLFSPPWCVWVIQVPLSRCTSMLDGESVKWSSRTLPVTSRTTGFGCRGQSWVSASTRCCWQWMTRPVCMRTNAFKWVMLHCLAMCYS